MKRKTVFRIDNLSYNDIALLLQYNAKISPEYMIEEAKKGKSLFGSAALEEEEFLKVYPQLFSSIKGYRHVPCFTKKELDSAEFLILDYLHNHPDYRHEVEPDYRHLVFDLSNVCKYCGRGDSQIADYRFAVRPNTSRWKLFTAAWNYYMIFADKEFHETVLQPFGIKCRPVLSLKKSKILENVVQLVLPIIEEDMDMRDMNFDDCPECGRRIYSLEPEDFCRKYKSDNLPSMFEGKEFIGHLQGTRSKHIFISQELRQTLIAHKQLWRTRCIPLI
jgi:hypothetical protein